MLWDVALSHLLVRIDQVALAVKLGVRARDDDAMSVNVKMMISVPLLSLAQKSASLPVSNAGDDVSGKGGKGRRTE